MHKRSTYSASGSLFLCVGVLFTQERIRCILGVDCQKMVCTVAAQIRLKDKVFNSCLDLHLFGIVLLHHCHLDLKFPCLYSAKVSSWFQGILFVTSWPIFSNANEAVASYLTVTSRKTVRPSHQSFSRLGGKVVDVGLSKKHVLPLTLMYFSLKSI